MAIMDLNMTQDLAIIDQDLLLLVFQDLCKAYNTLDRRQHLQTLEGYGAGPKIWLLLTKL